MLGIAGVRLDSMVWIPFCFVCAWDLSRRVDMFFGCFPVESADVSSYISCFGGLRGGIPVSITFHGST